MLFFTNDVFILGEEGEIETNGFFRDSGELTTFIDKVLDKYNDRPSIYYTVNIYTYFRIFKQVNRSEHGRGVNEFYKFLEVEGENCCLPSEKDFFLE